MTTLYLGEHRVDLATEYDDVVGRYIDAAGRGEFLIYVEDVEGNELALPVKRVNAICA